MILRLGTRGSALATAQSGQFARAVTQQASTAGRDVTIEVVTVTTKGDIDRGSLVGLTQTGVFVTALREALLADECDFIVHSLKDMPTAPYPGLTTVAIPVREDPRDALCAGEFTLDTLPEHARIGTGSPRRAAQLLAVRGDLELVAIRGNVDTRLGMVGDALDGVVLAAAGLNRLDRAGQVSHLFEPDVMLPAPGQGALAIEIRDDAPAHLSDLLALLDHAPTRAAVLAERTALATLEAGCAAPVAAYATVAHGRLTLHTRVIRGDGGLVLNERNSGVVEAAAAIGRSSGYSLLGRGAARLMAGA